MVDKLAAFDIETWREFPSGEDWHPYAPLGIACASVNYNHKPGFLFYHWDENAVSELDIEGVNKLPIPSSDCMTQTESIELVDYLSQLTIPIVTFNGTFDFEVLSIESGEVKKCAKLAMKSFDVMYHVHCIKGFPVGLDALSKGMGLKGKTEGMHGDLAPKMWKEGIASRLSVLDYVSDDTKATLELFEAIKQSKQLRWVAKSGRPNAINMPEMLTVEECMRLPLPDTSWMAKPIPRDNFYKWAADWR